MITPAPPLSPAAQAVWDAAWTNCPVQCGDIEGTRRSQIAAALIAAADQVFPLMRMPDPEECDYSQDYDYLSIVFGEQAEGKNKLLAIAAELKDN